MVRLTRDFDIECRVRGNGEALATTDGLPILTVEAVTAGSAEGFHDFAGTGVKGKGSRKNDTDGLPGTIGKDDGVTDTLFTIDIGLLDDGYVFKALIGL